MSESKPVQTIQFKAETQQLLQILIHSLYAEREVFLRELISNASDALTRLKFIMLTDHDVLEPEAELAIRIQVDKDTNQLTISDSGIGMNEDEIIENLGTIAHSGVKSFVEAFAEGNQELSDLIGQFGVGFYSAFMAADEIEVTSHSYRPGDTGIIWRSKGADTYTIEENGRESRGTSITLHLNEQSKEFLEEYRLREIIKKHSNFIPYPIYIGEDEAPANQQTALWRQTPSSIESDQYHDYYRQYTLDFEEPLTHLHLVVDAPVQLFSLLYVPKRPERQMFSLRKQDGLELFARKVLIQEYNLDLLPQCFRFIQGVVDSEDIPLNVSRETIQSTRVMRSIKKILTSRLISHLERMQKNEADTYQDFWKTYGLFIKEGIATDDENYESLLDLLWFRTNQHPNEWITLAQYFEEMKDGQEKIYYLMGEDETSVKNSPHLELLEKLGYDVLFMTDPVDSFMLMRLHEYKEKQLANIASEKFDDRTADETPTEDEEQEKETTSKKDSNQLVKRFIKALGDDVENVRVTDRLSKSPARIIDAEGSLPQEIQRVYEMLNQEFEKPKKILEINPNHPLLRKLSELDQKDPLSKLIIKQIYEDALLIEGQHPDPTSMIERIQEIMNRALGGE